MKEENQCVSRAGDKLANFSEISPLHLKEKIVLDVGSSSGGFTNFALLQGAKKVIAVEKGTNQLNQKLRFDQRVELHEKTNIKQFRTNQKVDFALIDVSFESVRNILDSILQIAPRCEIVVLVKPQFEARPYQLENGIIKNSTVRRVLLVDFENWAKNKFAILAKADSQPAGKHGNKERFYRLKPL